MSNHYAEVIELLTDPNLDLRHIALKLAKTSPSTFLRLYRGEHAPYVKRVSKPKTEPLQPLLTRDQVYRICSHLNNSLYIEAIKELRQSTCCMMNPHGLSLKDAKDVIDVIRYGSGHLPSVELMRYVNEIKSGWREITG